MITKEQLINIGSEKLAEIILSLYNSNISIQKQLDVILASLDEDPKKIVSMIKAEIASLKKSSRFIDYYESSDFATKIDQLRMHITRDLLPRFPNHAVDLLTAFLDLHPKTLNRVDDSNGVIGDVFIKACADLANAYAAVTTSLEDMIELVFNRFMNNGYAVYDDIIFNFKTILGDEGLKLLEQKLKHAYNSKNTMRISIGLKQIADCQDDVDAYISACSFNAKPSAHEHLEIAERFIKHWKGQEAIKWLDSIDLPHTHSWQHKRKDLKIEALELCGKYQEAQTERLHWFEETLSPSVYKEIVKYAEVDFIGSFHKIAIQKALEFHDPYTAITFLVAIQEFEPLAILVHSKSSDLDGSNYNILRPAADVLHKIDPLAATLLYRKMIQPILANTKSKYYNYAAKDLVTCGILSNQITDWKQYQNHEIYFLELSMQHKRKTSFWAGYQAAIAKQKQKEAKILRDKS